MTDIVREVIERAKARIAEAYGLPPEVAELLGKVEAEIKREYRGDRFYIQAPPELNASKATKIPTHAVVLDYLAEDRIDDIQAKHGISRASIYRYLKRS